MRRPSASVTSCTSRRSDESTRLRVMTTASAPVSRAIRAICAPLPRTFTPCSTKPFFEASSSKNPTGRSSENGSARICRATECPRSPAPYSSTGVASAPGCERPSISARNTRRAAPISSSAIGSTASTTLRGITAVKNTSATSGTHTPTAATDRCFASSSEPTTKRLRYRPFQIPHSTCSTIAARAIRPMPRNTSDQAVS